MTNKEMILTADPTAICDYYELLRGAGKPCWYIRSGLCGPIRSAICASPRAAWKESADRFRKDCIVQIKALCSGG